MSIRTVDAILGRRPSAVEKILPERNALGCGLTAILDKSKKYITLAIVSSTDRFIEQLSQAEQTKLYEALRKKLYKAA